MNALDSTPWPSKPKRQPKLWQQSSKNFMLKTKIRAHRVTLSPRNNPKVSSKTRKRQRKMAQSLNSKLLKRKEKEMMTVLAVPRTMISKTMQNEALEHFPCQKLTSATYKILAKLKR